MAVLHARTPPADDIVDFVEEEPSVGIVGPRLHDDVGDRKQSTVFEAYTDVVPDGLVDSLVISGLELPTANMLGFAVVTTDAVPTGTADFAEPTAEFADIRRP